jgi:diadenosine tetraphosphatase ApaH/serine/threonine PP2A family protein phosphatase
MSLLAIISDIHANIDALDAVMEDIDSQKVDEIICLGDVVGYGAAPSECVSIIRNRCVKTVMGNHDHMTAQPGVLLASEHVAAGIRYARTSLSGDELKWLAALPYQVTAYGCSFVHASLAIPEEFAYLTTDQEAELHFDIQESDVSFMGHTHIPQVVFPISERFIWSDPTKEPFKVGDNVRCAINVGSVGQPRDNDPRASYGLFETDSRCFQLRRVRYNIEKAQDRIGAAGLPEENARRLAEGN